MKEIINEYMKILLEERRLQTKKLEYTELVNDKIKEETNTEKRFEIWHKYQIKNSRNDITFGGALQYLIENICKGWSRLEIIPLADLVAGAYGYEDISQDIIDKAKEQIIVENINSCKFDW